MRSRIPGIHRVKSKGRSYYYHRATGTRLFNEPGTPEFFAELAEVAHKSVRDQTGTVDEMVAQYLKSAEFRGLKPSTQAGYRHNLDRVKARYGKHKAKSLNSPKARTSFFKWRDTMAETPAMADSVITTLRALLSWAVKRGLLDANHAAGIEKISKRADRADKLWLDSHIAAFEKEAPEHLIHGLHLGILTGQRLGDLCAFRWSDIKGGIWVCTQQKTGKTVYIPIYDALQDRMDKIEKRGPFVLTDEKGQPLKPKNFSNRFKYYRIKSGIEGLDFHDTRGTCATKLAEAGSTPEQIGSITGHSRADISTILDAYIARSATLSRAAIINLERTKKEQSL